MTTEYRVVISEILPRANIAAMRKALAASGRFALDKTDDTLIDGGGAMNLPSVKTLMRIGPLKNDKQRAKLLRKVLESNTRSARYRLINKHRPLFEVTDKWISACHNIPSPSEMKFSMANDIIGGFGVEYVGKVDMRDGPPLEYVNLGDTYDVTLCRFQGRWIVCSWGDIVERHEKLFREE